MLLTDTAQLTSLPNMSNFPFCAGFAAVAVMATVLVGPRAAEAQRAAVSAFPPDSAVLAVIKQRVEEKRSAGVVVGLLDADGHTRIVAFGGAGKGQPPLDGNTVFEIGSISKVFTSTILAELVKEGKVKLEDPVQKYLPASVHVPMRNGKEITLANLSEQNSGLPRMPSNFHPKDPANPYADYTEQQMYDFISGYQLPRDPGATFEYSNLGVGLLGHALSRAVGTSYEEMERKRVWEPLGMTHTAITLTPWMKQHLALGHDGNGDVTANWDLPTFAGAGAIRSTTEDMLKFASANLHPERGKLQEAMAFAHIERAPGGSPVMGIGLNWFSRHALADADVRARDHRAGWSALHASDRPADVAAVGRNADRFLSERDRCADHLRARTGRHTDIARAASERTESDCEENGAVVDGAVNIRITVSALRFLAGRFEDALAPKSCAAFRARFPFSNELIQARWSGEAGWIPLGDFDFGVPVENATNMPAPGELLLYPAAVSETEILFPYGECRFASKHGPLSGNHFITIVEGAEQFAALGQLILTKGAQRLVFAMEGTAG